MSLKKNGVIKKEEKRSLKFFFIVDPNQISAVTTNPVLKESSSMDLTDQNYFVKPPLHNPTKLTLSH